MTCKAADKMIVHRWFILVVTVAFIQLTTANQIDSKLCKDLRIKNGPVIYPCVSEIILQKGQNYTLTCKGETELQFKQQHISEEVTSDFHIDYTTSSQISEKGFSFERKLELYNIDQFAIGYYACADNTVNLSDFFIDKITKDAINSEHVSFIYVYVNGTNDLFAPMRELVLSRSNMVLIECKPTTPDVKIQLYPPQDISGIVYSPKVGFSFYYDNATPLTMFSCDFEKDGRTVNKEIYVQHQEPPPIPKIKYDSDFFLKGETFSLNCTVSIKPNIITTLSWKLPDNISIYNYDTNSGNVSEGIVYNNITIINATQDHAGLYQCISANSCDKRVDNVTKKLTVPRLILVPKSGKEIEGVYEVKSKGMPTASINVEVEAYPKPTFKILKNGQELLITPDNDKYTLTYDEEDINWLIFGFRQLNITDTANYTVVADNGYLKETADFVFKRYVKPIINFGQGDKKCVPGMTKTIACEVSGYPLPIVSWEFTNDNNLSRELNSWKVDNTSIFSVTAYLLIKNCVSGRIECRATNTDGERAEPKSHNLLVYEINNGFGIDPGTNNYNGTIWVNEDDNVTLKCLASKYEYSDVSWVLTGDKKLTVEYPDTEYSHVAMLKIDKITMNHTRSYICYGTKNGTEEYDEVQINVLKLQNPVILEAEDEERHVDRFDDTELKCIAVGAPRPEIKWFKDGILFNTTKYTKVYYNDLNITAVNSSIVIEKIQPENVGSYACEAKNYRASQIKSFELKLKVQESNIKHYVIAIAVIILLLIILIVYLTLKIKKEKKFRKELAAAGLLYFKEGVTKSINPDLGIDEQAELLPYKEEFEFPVEKLMLGKQLGAGAFGVVYKAEARGIVNAEETTPVAVKMVKKTADNMYIKALASELKIMVHLGKHINIVNLLGACTKNVGKRELVVIVEYCRYGNIHNYMQRHREVFIDQLETDNKEKLGKVNRAYTSSSCGSTGAQSDYFGSANTQNTDHTCLNTANTVHSTRKNIPNNNQPIKEVEEAKASEGYVQPEWRSNYETDYSYDGRAPRPLSSRDLLAWSFQIARGMEYLASRKVLHGDLAARNILLADDNIVKICDFGLAKSIYKNDEYQKNENALLPWKWLAIECMTDRIFSTQSDVWSFGIVLWELFTLAKTPYPNMHPTSLLQFLTDGHRLDKPAYADERLYNVMKKCWEAKPTQRPTFSQLQLLLGSFLEDNVRNHYVDLNSAYMDKNAKDEGQEDYLAMVSAPDYNNMVTPSPHHYVNTDRNFFPANTPKVDEAGYLQISPSNQGIFSPRIPDTEFDFDPRKLNVKMSEANSGGSELTPMLTLNNLPTRSGSESDHEGNPPYLNACPRIEEETDEVFTPCLNEKNAKNTQQSAVTNPTYITFDNYDEKPKDIINYVNINVPNGLVK